MVARTPARTVAGTVAARVMEARMADVRPTEGRTAGRQTAAGGTAAKETQAKAEVKVDAAPVKARADDGKFTPKDAKPDTGTAGAIST